LENFSAAPCNVPVPNGAFDLLAQTDVSDVLAVPPWGSTVLRRARHR
jgi:hypothetical protein